MKPFYLKKSPKNPVTGTQEYDEFLAMHQRDGLTWEDVNRRIDSWLRKNEENYQEKSRMDLQTAAAH